MEEEQQGRSGDLQRPQGLQPPFSHRDDLPVSGEDQPDSDRAEDSEEGFGEEVADSEENDLTLDGHLKQFWAFEKAYQRGPKLSLRSYQIKKKADRELSTVPNAVKSSISSFKLPIQMVR